MKIKVVSLLFLLGVVSPVSVFALDIPTASPLDSNIQFADYRSNEVVAITAYIGMGTHIVLSKNEVIKDAIVGFSDGWETLVKGNHLFLKAKSTAGTRSSTDEEGNVFTENVLVQPTPEQWKTNLTLVTDQRIYSFLLRLGVGEKSRRQNTFRLTFGYPEEKAALLQQQRTKKRAMSKKRTPVPAQRNWKYMMQIGKQSRNIAPIKAFDDGRFTYFSFAQNSEIPAIFIVSETGKETLVNSHINPDNPNTLVIQRIAQQFVFRLGKSVVGVTNNAFNTLVVDTRSGSTIDNVTRTLKGQE